MLPGQAGAGRGPGPRSWLQTRGSFQGSFGLRNPDAGPEVGVTVARGHPMRRATDSIRPAGRLAKARGAARWVGWLRGRPARAHWQVRSARQAGPGVTGTGHRESATGSHGHGGGVTHCARQCLREGPLPPGRGRCQTGRMRRRHDPGLPCWHLGLCHGRALALKLNRKLHAARRCDDWRWQLLVARSRRQHTRRPQDRKLAELLRKLLPRSGSLLSCRARWESQV